jgi:hypothetical protein
LLLPVFCIDRVEGADALAAWVVFNECYTTPDVNLVLFLKKFLLVGIDGIGAELLCVVMYWHVERQ